MRSGPSLAARCLRWSSSRGRSDRKRLGAQGRLICFDRDPEAMELAKARMDEVRAELGSEMPEVVFEPRAFRSEEAGRAGQADLLRPRPGGDGAGEGPDG